MPLNGLFQDLKHGARTLSRHPGTTLVAVVCIALGIGANTTMFSLVNAVFFKPLPVGKPERLIAVHTRDRGSEGPIGGYRVSSYPDYLDLRLESQSFDGLVAFSHARLSLSGNAEPEIVLGIMASGNYFEVLGVRPALGRGFLPEEDARPGTHLVAVIGDGLWKRRYGADPGVVGRRILINAREFTVVGVAPVGFAGTEVSEEVPDL